MAIIGEVQFEVGGKGYGIKLGTYALAILQRETGIPTLKFFSRKPDEFGVDDMLRVFHAGMYQRHKLTEESVGDLLDEMGQEKLAQVFRDVLIAAFGEVASGTENPPKPVESGISTPSTATG